MIFAQHEPLPLVAQYQHLGIVLAQGCDLQCDLHVKIGKAAQAFRIMQRNIFGNRHVSILPPDSNCLTPWCCPYFFMVVAVGRS